MCGRAGAGNATSKCCGNSERAVKEGNRMEGAPAVRAYHALNSILVIIKYGASIREDVHWEEII